ncbi:hypothetical protein [Curtobacterium sp. Curtsp57]|uniref:hypothetical protein n=1 Tax=Curtobacterium sp. Curtsp57 TaxID=3243047 RepID=UPI0039B51B08
MSVAKKLVQDLLSKRDLNELQVQALGAAATVVLGEEQRVANLIAWHGYVAAQGDLPDIEAELAQQIEEALA